MRKKPDPVFTLRFAATEVKDIPARLREIAEEIPQEIGPVGTWGGPDGRRWLLLHGNGKQR